MDDKNLLLKADPNLTFSINTQIKEQLKWLIGIGRIQPGDMLPPANQLAEQLGLNRNTVNLVYNQLRDEGLVSMQKGRGTQVIQSPRLEELQKKRVPMHELVTKIIEEANAQNLPLHDLFTAGLAYILLENREMPDPPRILFVECKEHDHLFYRNEIERITGAEVRPVFLEDLLSSESALHEALEYSHTVITTLNHDDDVKHLFSRHDKRVSVIGATVETPLLLEMAKLKPGSSVSFVCLGQAGGQWMASRVQDAGITQIEATAIGLDDRNRLLQSIQRSDKVYASQAVYDEMKAIAPGKVELYPMVLERSSENLLKEAAKVAV